MATADNSHGNDARHPGGTISATLGGAKTWLRRSRAYRRTIRELSAMTDGELNLMGLSRTMIRPVARQAAMVA